jgi:hypothetical protein
MKKPTVIGLVVISLVLSTGFVIKDPGWIIGPETKLVIHGQTNINSFHCRMDCYQRMDTLSYSMDDDKCMLFFNENRMRIPVVNFDCGSRLINSDFYDVLKKDTYPFVYIQFVALERWTGNTEVGGTVYITLAGVTKPFIIHYQINSTSKVLLLKGRQKICFSDFNLKPPEKMFGTIKVQDNLEVEFDLALRAL